jgi:hypothetical protein
MIRIAFVERRRLSLSQHPYFVKTRRAEAKLAPLLGFPGRVLLSLTPTDSFASKSRSALLSS